jgi:hypothetical protein
LENLLFEFEVNDKKEDEFLCSCENFQCLSLVYIEVEFLNLIGLEGFHADRQRGRVKEDLSLSGNGEKFIAAFKCFASVAA